MTSRKLPQKGNSYAQKLVSQGSQESATRYAQALWEEERRQHFLRTCEQIGQRKDEASTHPFDLRKTKAKHKPTKALLETLYTQTPLNAKDISFFYDVSPSTVRRWLSECDIPIKRQGKIHIHRKKNFKRRRIINGIPHKLCRGPSHKSPTYVPFEEFSPNSQPNHSVDGIRGQCKDCDALYQGHPRMVPFEKIKFALTELVNRLGFNEACRRANISTTSMWKYRYREPNHVHRDTAEKILKALADVRKNGSVRHVDSITHGAIQRGRTEKIPSKNRDFYNKSSDLENEQRQALRRSGITPRV